MGSSMVNDKDVKKLYRKKDWIRKEIKKRRRVKRYKAEEE
jgi:hypothetical protein